MKSPIPISEYRELVRLQDSYIDILVDELSEIVGEGLAGGWVSTRAAEINRLRGQIKGAKKSCRIPVWRRRRSANADI